MFTDLVESTRRVEGLGDDAWRELLAAHDETIRTHLARFSRTEVKHRGDGFLATFDGPARAIQRAVRESPLAHSVVDMNVLVAALMLLVTGARRG